MQSVCSDPAPPLAAQFLLLKSMSELDAERDSNPTSEEAIIELNVWGIPDPHSIEMADALYVGQKRANTRTQHHFDSVRSTTVAVWSKTK